MRYEVRLGSAARRELKRLHSELLPAVLDSIERLADDPRPARSVPLKADLAGLHRMRVGAIRVAYHVDDAHRIVTVVAVGTRGSFYKGGAGDRKRG